MARPRKINPQGEVRRLTVQLPAQVAARLEREARKRGVPVAEVLREKVLQVA